MKKILKIFTAISVSCMILILSAIPAGAASFFSFKIGGICSPRIILKALNRGECEKKCKNNCENKANTECVSENCKIPSADLTSAVSVPECIKDACEPKADAECEACDNTEPCGKNAAAIEKLKRIVEIYKGIMSEDDVAMSAPAMLLKSYGVDISKAGICEDCEPKSDCTDCANERTDEKDCINCEPTAEASDKNTYDVTYGIYTEERKVVELVNEIRRSYGLSELKINAELCRLARIKSCDMSEKSYFSHQSPTYGSAFDMMKANNIKYRSAGENIASGYRDARSVVDAWMNSEGHRANILNSSFTEIGVGLCGSGNYWTQMFIG